MGKEIDDNSIYLGITVKKSSKKIEEEEDSKQSGVEVLLVNEDSPAEKAGIRKGDILTTINRVHISSKNEMLEAARTIEAGQKIPVEVIRAGSIMRIFIRFQKK